MQLDDISWLKATTLETIASSEHRVEKIVDALRPALGQNEEEPKQDDIYWYVVKRNG